MGLDLGHFSLISGVLGLDLGHYCPVLGVLDLNFFVSFLDLFGGSGTEFVPFLGLFGGAGPGFVPFGTFSGILGPFINSNNRYSIKIHKLRIPARYEATIAKINIFCTLSTVIKGSSRVQQHYGAT